MGQESALTYLSGDQEEFKPVVFVFWANACRVLAALMVQNTLLGNRSGFLEFGCTLPVCQKLFLMVLFGF
jgi:hypothetical protein